MTDDPTFTPVERARAAAWKKAADTRVGNQRHRKARMFLLNHIGGIERWTIQSRLGI